LAQQDKITRRIVDDPYWKIPYVDRLVGKINRYDVLLKRTVLFKLSSLRSFWRQLRLG
jgi:hypothetical protein